MPQLTDTQLIVLSKAAARDDGAATVPDRMNKAAAAKVASSLVTRKLMRELRAKPSMPVWREDADGHRISLIITRAGREAVGIEDSEESHRKALNIGEDKNTEAREQAHNSPREGSKQALVVAMLSKAKGATLDQLTEATGWLPHTTRAALTGLRKRGFAIERIRSDGKPSTYRIIDAPKTSDEA